MPRRRLFRSKSPAYSPVAAHLPSAHSTPRATPVLSSKHAIEPLEQRLMMTLLNGTGTTVQKDYYALGGGGIRVAVHDASVELIGVGVGTTSNAGLAANLVEDTMTPVPTIIPNLYAIYILQSNADSWISIGLVALPATTASATNSDNPIILTGSPTINVNDSGTPTSATLIAAPIGNTNGAALLGNLSTATGNTGEPIMSVTNNNTVTGPYQPTTFYPGVYMSPVALNTSGVAEDPTTGLAVAAGGDDTPNDLGRFFFAGVITGSVDIPSPADAGITNIPAEPASQGGNVGVFYAGAILTGDARGVAQQDETSASDNDNGGLPTETDGSNFYVGGDIRDLISSGSIGGGRGAAPRTDLSQYNTDFRLVAEGTIGDVESLNGGVYGSVQAEHLPSVYGLTDFLFTETELEAQNKFPENAAAEAGDYFGPNDAGEIYTQNGYPLLPSDIYDNNTPADQNAGADDFTTEGDPQYLGSIRETDTTTDLPLVDTHGNYVYEAEVDGIVQGAAPNPETEDNYAIPLIAGQQITPSLDSLTGPLTLNLIDPDGRVVASETAAEGAITTPFFYTADRPGIYDIEITEKGNSVISGNSYDLTIGGVGNMGLGEIVAKDGDIYDEGMDSAFETDAGDLGAMIAPPTFSIASTTTGPTAVTGATTEPEGYSVYVPDGNLRVVKAGQLGVANSDQQGSAISLTIENPIVPTGEFGAVPILNVPAGAIGLLEGLDTTGFLSVFTPFNVNATANVTGDAFTVPSSPVGGDIQVIDGLGSVFLDVATNQGIGTINAGNMATKIPSFIDVNADNTGNDGIIDLINVAGDLGTLGAGGPGIVTNDGGYVRYMRVGGDIYQDSFFGGGRPTNTTYAAGVTATVTDDTGATFTIAPVGSVTTTTVDDNGTTTTTSTGPQISLTSYGIRDKGGGVIVDADCIGGTLDITASAGDASNNEADISLISFTGSSINQVAPETSAGVAVLNANGEQELSTTATGTATVASTTTTTGVDGSGNTETTTVTVTAGPTASSLLISGTAAVYVLDVIANGNIDQIENNTVGGELASISGSAASIGEIYSRGTLGLLSKTTPAAVVLANSPTEQNTATTGGAQLDGTLRNTTMGAFTAGNTFPWNLQTNGIYLTGDVMTIESGQGLGNIDVVGTIGSVIANVNHQTTSGIFSGINAPVAAGPLDEPANAIATLNGVDYSTQYNILSVSIGQGIMPSGTSSFSLAGVYADGDIGLVTNAGVAQADIRGTVMARVKIDEISLNGGSIIDAKVLAATPLAASQAGGTLTVTDLETAANTTLNYELGQVIISGRGGIIGGDFVAFNTQEIAVGAQGYGIFDTTIGSGGDGTVNQISAGGYGIRTTTITGGATLNSLNVTGNGSQLPVTDFGQDVRESETQTDDPYSGQVLSIDNDLDANLGTSAANPTSGQATQTGVLEDDVIKESTSLGIVRAQIIRVSEPLDDLGQAFPVANIPVPGQAFPMEFAVAGSIGAIAVRGTIDGLEITTGHIGTFSQIGSVSRLGISVAGAITALTIRGNFGQTITDPATDLPIPDSYISATGAEGSIGNLVVYGDLNGNVTATNVITSMIVRGNVNGTITAQGQAKILTLSKLVIGGALKDGSLVVNGSAGSITTSGGLGDTAGSITIVGNLNSLTVGASHAHGSVLASALTVDGTLGTLSVYGQISGAVTVTGDLKALKVVNDGTSPNVINAPINVDGRLLAASIVNGNVAANITAVGYIKSFNILRGSVLFGSTIESQVDAIQSFIIAGGLAYGMYGTLAAPGGYNQNISISGNLGNGTNAATISAISGSQFHIKGSIETGAAITLSQGLNSLQVDGNIATGASVTAHPLKKLKVKGTQNGTIIAV